MHTQWSGPVQSDGWLDGRKKNTHGVYNHFPPGRTEQRVLPALSGFCPKTQPIFALTLALGLAFALVLALALALAIAIVFPLLFPCVPCVYSPTSNSPTWNSHPQ